MIHRLALANLQRLHPLFVMVLILTVVTFAYLPGLHGPFVLDDGENITLNPAVALDNLTMAGVRDALNSNDGGLFKRPLATLSFALNHYQAGGFQDTFPFKLTNLLVHGINSLLVFLLVLRLMRISAPGATLTDTGHLRVAALTAGLWALHPIQLTSVLYVVQRMNSLSALFVFLGLLMFLHGRACLEARPQRGLWLMSFGVLGGMLLGILAKENAVLLPLLALVIEYTVIRGFAHPSPLRQRLWTFYIVMVAIPLLIALLLLLIQPDSLLSGYLTRPFTPLERALTETRVLWRYLGLLLFPNSSSLGLFHDDIAVSTGLFTPHSTLPALAGLCIAFGAAVAKARHYPVLAFGVLWYLAGHSLESSFLGLEIAFEHRNYVPSLGVFLCLSYGAVRLAARSDSRQKQYLLALIGMVLLTIGATTWSRATTWSDIHALSISEARNHPASARANDLAARISLEKNDITGAVRYTIQGLRAAPWEAGFHMDLRILLAHLSFEVNELMEKRFSSQERQDAQITIQNLPKEIVATTNTARLQLQYPGSTDTIIAQLLREQPITAHAVVTFENLTHCLTSGQPSCQSLQPLALGWLGIALENPRTGKTYRGILAANAARLHAHQNDIRRALEYMNRAAALLPHHFSYRLAQIDYLLKLGQADKAIEIMDHLRRTWPQNDIEWTINKPSIDDIISRLNVRSGQAVTGTRMAGSR